MLRLRTVGHRCVAVAARDLLAFDGAGDRPGFRCAAGWFVGPLKREKLWRRLRSKANSDSSSAGSKASEVEEAEPC